MNILEVSKELIEDSSKRFRHTHCTENGEIDFWCDMYASKSWISIDELGGFKEVNKCGLLHSDEM